eukprot:2084025-Prymnesium_polylepis.1
MDATHSALCQLWSRARRRKRRCRRQSPTLDIVYGTENLVAGEPQTWRKNRRPPRSVLCSKRGEDVVLHQHGVHRAKGGVISSTPPVKGVMR